MNGPPDTLQRCVRRMRMRAGLNAPPCDYVRGREVECTAPPLERPCWAPRPRARLKARPVWRSPRLGSSWIKDGSLEGQERWEAPRLHTEDKQMLAETGRKEKDDWRKERSSFKTAKTSIYQLFNKNSYSVRRVRTTDDVVLYGSHIYAKSMCGKHRATCS